MAKQLGFYVDLSNCTGCKACQIACKDKNNLPIGTVWRRVFEYAGGNWLADNGQMLPSNVYAYYVSSACMHCQNPACVEVCPTTAMRKGADGIVTIYADFCIGCRYCQWACPYGAPQFNEQVGKMTKCNFCQDLLAAGERPACVDGCPYRALDFGELSDLQAKHGGMSDPAPLPDPRLTHPSVVFKPHASTVSSDSGNGKILNIELIGDVK
jgi:anaerobic dimethyl sulfoxide reductase subunit B (iron-sulfur subunit)